MPLCNLDDMKKILPSRGGLLGLDPGKVAIGVAICDPMRLVASPLATITRAKFAQDAAALLKIIQERAIVGLIVGLPKNMDGSEGASAQAARAFIRNLLSAQGMPDLPVALWDERLSTAAVERFMIADDMTRKRRDATIDKAAAAYILQGALDRLQRM